MSRRTIDQLYALTIPEVQTIFLEVMQGIVDDAILSEMVQAIEAGDVDRLFQATGFTPAALGPILDRIEQTYKDAADITVDGWPSLIRTPTGLVRFRFDIRNEIAERDLRELSSTLITRMTNEARENVRSTLERGMIEGRNPRSTALDIVGRIDPKTRKRVGGVIGLTNSQERWAATSKLRLEQLDTKYFNMGLRDKRFDGVVKKAIEENKKLPSSQIEKIVIAYKNNALKYRGQMVARTETLQSINRGEFNAYRQAVSKGTIKESALTKEWDDVGDSRERTTHRILGEKYGKNKGIPLEEAFVSPSGSLLLYPGDVTLGAEAGEIIHCRCKLFYRVDWIKNAGDLNG